MAVNLEHFLNRVGFNELGTEPLVDNQNYAILELDSDGRGAALDRLTDVLDLKESPVGREYGDGAVIRHVACLH